MRLAKGRLPINDAWGGRCQQPAVKVLCSAPSSHPKFLALPAARV